MIRLVQNNIDVLIIGAGLSRSTCSVLLIWQLKGESVSWEKDDCIQLMEGVNTFRTFVNVWYYV